MWIIALPSGAGMLASVPLSPRSLAQMKVYLP